MLQEPCERNRLHSDGLQWQVGGAKKQKIGYIELGQNLLKRRVVHAPCWVTEENINGSINLY